MNTRFTGIAHKTKQKICLLSPYFHRFPRDPITNKLWKRFCKLSDIDDVRNLFLCSKHFKKTDFIVTKSEQPGNGGARLNHDAVPTISKAATPPPTAKQPVKPMLLEVKNIVPSDPLGWCLFSPLWLKSQTFACFRFRTVHPYANCSKNQYIPWSVLAGYLFKKAF